MKKLFVAVALVIGLGTSMALANNVWTNNLVETLIPTDDYTQIELKYVPQAITDAVAKNYEGNSIKEAYVKTAEDGTKTYKIILMDGEETESVVLFNEKGEEVKEAEE